MFIYIGGTYSKQTTKQSRFRTIKFDEEDIRRINKAAIEIARKGHLPFIPYMIQASRNSDLLAQNQVRQLSYRWLEKCDAVYFIKPLLEGEAENQRQFALNKNLPVFYDLDNIPEVHRVLTSEALQVYLTEYQQCMENYRHTYAIIWQAGAIFAAISAAIITFSSYSNVGVNSFTIPPLIQVIVLIPLLFWYLGIFRPLNRYCELHSDRVVQIEELLNASVSGLYLSHFQKFRLYRKGEGIFKRILTFKWLFRPRVSEIVTILGIIMIIAEIYLLWSYYFSHWL